MAAAPKPETLAAFEAAKGFMPVREGLALREAAAEAARLGLPLLEVGTYCGRSTILLADAAREAGVAAITVDHHRGSEEQQPGWEYHDPTVVDPEIGMNVVELALIKQVILGDDETEIKMILTTPFCPYAGSLIQQVREAAEEAEGHDVKVTLLAERWDPRDAGLTW